jgi:hypothetical protein
MTIAVSMLDNAISSKWTDHFWSNLYLDRIVTIVPSTQRSPQHWYKDLVTATTTSTAQQHSTGDWFMQQQQQQEQDASHFSSIHNNTALAATVMNHMILTPTTPITSWSIQVHQQEETRGPTRRQHPQQDEPHPKQQKRFHSPHHISRYQSEVEYAIIVQDDDYNNGGHGGSIVWKTAAGNDDDDRHKDIESFNNSKS